MARSFSQNFDELSSNSNTEISFTCEEIDEYSFTDNNVAMSLVWAGGMLSVAYYDMSLSALFIMNEIAESEEFINIRKVLNQVNPSIIISSCRHDDRLIQMLTTYCSSTKDSSDLLSLVKVSVDLLPNNEFLFESCRHTLLQARYAGYPKMNTDHERYIYLSSIIPLDSVNMVRAAGALVKYLERKRIGMELEEGNKIPILGMKIFQLDDIMLIDDTTYSSLQIFQTENHPSAYKNSSKEGLSLFGVMNRCRTQLGAKTLRSWFRCPLNSIALLRDRLSAVSYLISGHNIEFMTSLQSCVKNIKNISHVLRRMILAEVSLNGWQSMYKTIYNAICMANLCHSFADTTADIRIFNQIRQLCTDTLKQIAAEIDVVIDFEAFAIEKRFALKHGFDADLDEKRKLYASLPDLLTKVAREEIVKLPQIPKCQVAYLPLVGYLLAIPTTDTMKQTGDYNLDGIDFKFITNDIAYYKTPSTTALDSLLGDMKSDINDIQTRWMHTLQDRILEHVELLQNVLKCSAELDCLLALATAAKDNNYSCPKLTEDNVIEIKGGRHPLQELCCNLFVPNDIFSNDNNKMKILTGPNASGKSIYLKQIGLIVFLAHIGSFVPAERALIGPIESIYTRIRTTESVGIPLSSFAIDLNQVSIAVKRASAKSLVIIDEFGKGTEAVDGLALLAATLQNWLDLNTECPHVLVSTHFHRLVNGSMLQSPLLCYQTIEIVQNNEELVYLYQLKDGVAGASYALHVASSAGLAPNVLERAQEVTELIRQGKPVKRITSDSSVQTLDRCRIIVEKFLTLDLAKDDLQCFLQTFVLPIYHTGFSN